MVLRTHMDTKRCSQHKNINFFRDTHAKPWLQVTILVQQFFGGLWKYDVRGVGEAEFESRFTNMEHHIELELESLNI